MALQIYTPFRADIHKFAGGQALGAGIGGGLAQAGEGMAEYFKVKRQRKDAEEAMDMVLKAFMPTEKEGKATLDPARPEGSFGGPQSSAGSFNGSFGRSAPPTPEQFGAMAEDQGKKAKAVTNFLSVVAGMDKNKLEGLSYGQKQGLLQAFQMKTQMAQERRKMDLDERQLRSIDAYRKQQIAESRARQRATEQGPGRVVFETVELETGQKVTVAAKPNGSHQLIIGGRIPKGKPEKMEGSPFWKIEYENGEIDYRTGSEMSSLALAVERSLNQIPDAEEKKTFGQKIKEFFGGGKEEKAKPAEEKIAPPKKEPSPAEKPTTGPISGDKQIILHDDGTASVLNPRTGKYDRIEIPVPE